MKFIRRCTRMDPREIEVSPELEPKHDETLVRLMEQAIQGKTPAYFAKVPLSLCIPFDPDYNPETHPAGAAAIQFTYQDAVNGRFDRLLVYPRGKWFVVSDDYIPLFSALRGMPDYVPCIIFGMPNNALVEDVQGPISRNELVKLLGLS